MRETELQRLQRNIEYHHAVASTDPDADVRKIHAEVVKQLKAIHEPASKVHIQLKQHSERRALAGNGARDRGRS